MGEIREHRTVGYYCEKQTHINLMETSWAKIDQKSLKSP